MRPIRKLWQARDPQFADNEIRGVGGASHETVTTQSDRELAF
ncbi:MAG TPA: hypothetical protein VMH26_19365 [Burkholderiales bacterium]|nr:hypothetical protein [Burkholderiales bacterium]